MKRNRNPCRKAKSKKAILTLKTDAISTTPKSAVTATTAATKNNTKTKINCNIDNTKKCCSSNNRDNYINNSSSIRNVYINNYDNIQQQQQQQQLATISNLQFFFPTDTNRILSPEASISFVRSHFFYSEIKLFHNKFL